MTHLPALVTLLAIAVFFGCAAAVGRARSRYAIAAPATTGHLDFERIFRVQMNTLEALVMFLPALWIATQYGNPTHAGWIGLVWIVGRIWYAIAYAKDARKRGPGMMIGMLATTVLWLLGAYGVAMALLSGG